MPSSSHVRIGFVVLSGLLCFASGCTLKATLDTTSDTLSNFFSSTSGRSWLTEDGLVREDMKVDVFVAANRANLQQDIAQAEGEYLASLETLLAVPPTRRASFRRAALDHLQLLDHPGPDLPTFAHAMTASARTLQAQPIP